MNKDKKKNKQQNLGTMVTTLIFMICGALIGFLVENSQGETIGGRLFALSFLLGGLFLAIPLQIIIHESGHLICGLLSGYKFSSFRIGNFVWLKENGKIKFKKSPLAGIGGQCLMMPPKLTDGKMPFLLYNLGGVLLNIITGILFFAISVLCKDSFYISSLFKTGGIIGFAFALMNGIPLKLSAVNNDGYNILELRKSTEAVKSFWIQLDMTDKFSKGLRLKDLPQDYFFMPSDEGMKSGLTAAMAVFKCNRLMDMHEFEDAYKLMDTILKTESGIVGLHRNLLNCDRVYCELIGENRKEILDDILDKPQKDFMKSMKKFPSVLRMEYAYAIIAENDSEKAEKIKADFEKIAVTYLYQKDIESERELMRIAENISKNK